MFNILSSLSITAKLKALAIAGAILTATHSGAYLAGYLVGGAKVEASQAEEITTDLIKRNQSGEKSRDAFEKMSERERCLAIPIAGGVRNAECG
jgi:hypothetical protein